MNRNFLPSTTISELVGRQSYDRNVLDAVFRFVEFGLEPGSFTRAVILQDYYEAWGRAHNTLRRPQGGSAYDAGCPYASDGHSPISSMLLWASFLPDAIAGDEAKYKTWLMHRGLMGAPISKIVEVKLMWPTELYGRLKVPETRLGELVTHE